VEALEEVGELCDRPAGSSRAAQAIGVRTREERLVRHVEADHRDLDAALEDDGRGLRVDERVELRRRSDVALRDCAAHPDDALESLPDIGTALEQDRDVRERSGRHEHDARLEEVGEKVDRMRVDGLRRRFREVGPVESRLAVDVCRRPKLSHERPVGAGGDGDVGAAGELQDLERIAGRLVERLVAGDGRDAA
jgi:hypothetical protein